MADIDIYGFQIQSRLRQWDAEGQVYLAQDLSQQRWVDLYVVPPRAALFMNFSESFATLRHYPFQRHPCIAELLEMGESNGAVYFAIEHFSGQSLKQWFQKTQQFQLLNTLHLARQLSNTYQEFRQEKEAAQVLSQEEIFVNESGHLKVLPIQVIKAPKPIRSSHYAAHTGSLPSFDPLILTPEGLENLKLVDERSIIYSLGLLLYRMLSGRWPFPYKSLRDLCLALEADDPDPLKSEQELPQGLSELVHSCLRNDPKKRPQSLEKLHDALSTF